MLTIPVTPNRDNQTKVIGANTKASLAVPRNCIRKRATKKAIDIGTTSLPTEGLAMAIPETALVTETAGVKIPSDNVKLVPSKD